MVTLYYRGMAEENGKPKVGRSARLLGVRPSIDIDTEQMPRNWLDEQGYLRPEAERNPLSGQSVAVAIRNTKGMSVSLSIESLPAFRRPATFGGTGKDPLWQIDDSKITGDIEAVQDSPTHVSILPRATMLLEKYEAALANTQNDWDKV
ncbi:MAG: Tse2 family ADP-ribosyltransferase toxin [Nostoc sp.]